MRPFLFLLSMLNVLGWGYTQTREVVIEEEEDLVSIVRLWTKEDGLIHPEMTGFFEDSRGLVWIQNGNNLCYYDGRKIVAVEQEKTLLYDYRHYQFAEDKEGNIWRLRGSSDLHISSPFPDLDIYNPNLGQFYSLAEYLGVGPPPQFSKDLLLFSLNQTVYLFDKQQGVLWLYDGALSKVYTQGGQHAAGSVYLPGPDGYFWSMDSTFHIQLVDAKGTLIKDYAKTIGDGPLRNLFLTDNGVLWYRNKANQLPSPLDLPGGVRVEPLPAGGPVIPKLQFEFISGRSFSGINAINEVPFGYVSCPDLGGMNLLRAGDSRFQYPLLDLVGEAMPLSDIKATWPYFFVRFLSDGSLIVSVQGGFLHILSKKKVFKTYLKHKHVRNITILDTSTLAVTTYGLLKKDAFELGLNTGGHKKIELGKGASPYSIYNDDESIWVGNSDGSLVRHGRQWRRKARYPNPFYEPYTFMEKRAVNLQYHTDSTLWYATVDGVVEVDLKTDSSRVVWAYSTTNFLYRDHSGDFWVGTDKGLFHMPTQQFYLDSIQNQPVPASHIYEDASGVFWVSTQIGLVRWKPFTATHELFYERSGLNNPIIHAAYPDRHGRLWLSSNNGIMAFDTASKSVIVYLKEDGLAGNEQNYMAHCQAADGRIFFGGQEGVTAFDPNDIAPLPPTFHRGIQFSRVALRGKSGAGLDTLSLSRLGDEPVRLPRRAHQLQLSFFLPAHLPVPLKVEWQLDGEPSWQPLDKDYSVFLSGLPYGNFEVSVRAFYKGREDEAIYRKVDFYRPYPFYYAPWFWLIVALANILLFWGWWKYRNYKAYQLNTELAHTVRKRTQELEAERNKLKHLDATKTRLFRNISHEFRTPISVISLAIQQHLASGSAMSTSDMEFVQEEITYMNHMITELLELSKMEMGLVKVKPQLVEWNGMIARIFGVFEGMAAHKPLQYKLKLEPDTEIYTKTDSLKVEYVLNSLISNAIKYTPKGGQVYVYSTFHEEGVELVVADNGPGIAEEEQQAIFTPYYQSGHTESGQKAGGGFGIGLAMCKEYAGLLGGEVTLESKLGEGSSFSLKLPLETLPKPSSTGLAADNPMQVKRAPRMIADLLDEEQSKNKARLLIVEDNEQLLAQLQKLLGKLYKVETASNGETAYGLLAGQPDRFDLVISDIMMPVVDGFGLLQKVRAHPQLGWIPFLFLTALNDDEEQLKALRLGVDAFIAKPFDTRMLLDQIDNLMCRHSNRKQTLESEALLAGMNQVDKDRKAQGTAYSLEAYNDAWMRKLDEVVRQNLSRHDFTVSEIAEKLYVSERTLRNYVNNYTGLTPSAYLQKARLDQAMILIKIRKYRTVAEVALAVGFKGTRHFSKIFKQEFGEHPSTFLY